MKWKGKLIDKIIKELQDDPIWSSTIERILTDVSIGIHLAVFNEPFLALIYKGEKTIESRFSINLISPYMKISKGDIVILKASGGPVTGVFLAGEILFFSALNKSKLKEMESLYANQICSKYDPDFWINRQNTNYATLIYIKNLRALDPFRIEKKDRTAWSVLRSAYVNALL
jgi:hypothetical protein